MKLFGTIKLENKKILIECEPHVTIRLKRLFSKISVHSRGVHWVTANPENARDLLWFASRYPMDIDKADQAAIEKLAESHIELESYITKFYDEPYQPTAFDLDMAVEPREYQIQAAEFLFKTKGYLLGDDVGLGKTASSIAALCNPDLLPAIAVTYAHLPIQWEREIKKFAPHLRTHILKTVSPYPLDSPDVIITSYHKLNQWSPILSKYAKTIIFDECQELRRRESMKYDGARTIAAEMEYRMGLSATPIYNYGEEFHNVLNILCPDKLGTREEFLREWCNSYHSNGKARIKDPKAFGAYLKENGLMLRRTRQDVKRELPGKSIYTVTVEADTDALNQVSDSCAELARLILRDTEAHKGEKMKASGELDNILRQATGIAKAPYVANFVKLLIENGEKVVLYGWHRAVYEIWNDVLRHYKPAMYTGTESPAKKEQMKEQFISGESKVLIVSLRSGAGLDGLQHACRTVVFGEQDWSPAVMEQGFGRVLRDGQEEPVVIYHLVAEIGCDPIMIDINGTKSAQLHGVINFEKPVFEKIRVDTDHIKRLARSYLKEGK